MYNFKGRIILVRHTSVIGDYRKHRETIDCRDREFDTTRFEADLNLMRERKNDLRKGYARCNLIKT